MSLNITFNEKGVTRKIDNKEGAQVDSNGRIDELLEQYGDEIKRSKTIVFGGSFLALCVAPLIGTWVHSAFEITWLSIGVAALFFFIVVAFLRSKSTVLNVNYLFESESSKKANSSLIEGFNILNSSHKIWQNISSVAVEDRKYAGGASNSITRSSISAKLSLPSYILSDLQAPMIALAEGKLYFLPDRILLIGTEETQEFEYSDLSLSASACRFQESEGLPRDANVIDKTWRVINKSGGPDKRIKDNPEIPICKYDELHIYLGDNAFEIMVSKPNVSNQFGQALLDYKNFVQGSMLNSAHSPSVSEGTSTSVSFSHEELTQISLAGYLMMSIDGEVEESELHHYIEFAKKHHEHGESLDIEAFNAFMIDEIKELHNKYDSLVERVLSIGKSLNLSGEQKQEALTYLQGIIMADGVSTEEEQALLTAFVKVM